jgi:hypothetical protein
MQDKIITDCKLINSLKMWPLREEYRLRMFENRVLRRIFG